MTSLRIDTGSSKKQEVLSLQLKLQEKGYDIDVDGIYGQKTAEAVRRYQHDNGLKVDGIVGEETYNSLNTTVLKGYVCYNVNNSPLINSEIDSQQKNMLGNSIDSEPVSQDYVNESLLVNSSKSISEKLDTLQNILGVAGIIWPIADGINALVYLCRGDKVNAGIAVIAIIPFAGEAIKAYKTYKGLQTASDVTSKAMRMIEKVDKMNLSKINMFWTRGGRGFADNLLKEIQRLRPDLTVEMLENTRRGVQMEARVDKALKLLAKKETNLTPLQIESLSKQGKLWNELFSNHWTFYKDKYRFEKYQKYISGRYAKDVINNKKNGETAIFLIQGKGMLNTESIWRTIERVYLKEADFPSRFGLDGLIRQ